MSAEIEQRRRNVRVCDLLTESYEAHVRGDKATKQAKYNEACDVDSGSVVAITGGMYIGEVPSPENDWPGWLDYVETQREGLAQAESEQS